eukprot:12393669-Alexandrium_andersonii.AAC.1
MTDCGLRRIAAPTGLEQIADCTLGTLRCEDPRLSRLEVAPPEVRCSTNFRRVRMFAGRRTSDSAA